MSDISAIVNKYKGEIRDIIAANQNSLKEEMVRKVSEAIKNSQKNPEATINSKMDQMKDEITAAIKSSLPKF